jgi:uncharacterized glyoxalase superfamily protein PhnB
MAELMPYLAVVDGRAAIEWYVAHLGAELVDGPIVMDDGRVGHAELALEGARWMLSAEFPEIRVEAPASERGAAVTLLLVVDDVDALVDRAVRGGAVLDRGPEDAGPGRVAVVRDPFGHRWFLERPSG